MRQCITNKRNGDFVNKRVFEWIYVRCKKTFPLIALMTVLGCVLSLISLKFVGVSKNLINIATGQENGIWLDVALLLAALLVLRLLVQIGINFLDVHAASGMEISLKRHIFKNLLDKDYLAVTKYHSGELLNRLNSDVSVIVNGIIAILPSAAIFLTSIIGGFIYLYRIDKGIAIVILIVGPLVGIGARLYSKGYKRLHKKCQDADGKTKSFMLEILQNLLVVKSFCNEEKVTDESEKLQRESYRLRVRRTKISVIAHVGMFLIFNAGYYFALAYGAYKISKGEINFGEFTAILQLVNQIQAPFKDISGLVPQFFSVIASVERLLELEDVLLEQECEKIEDVASIYDKMQEIVFENVAFSYNEDSFVSDISMKIKKGECVVIGGESGAGKSTAIKLLLGIFEPSDGNIYIKTSSENISINKATRSLFSYVPQGNLILSGTIRENICFAKADASEEDIIKSAKIAQIWDFIQTLEDGLDTIIGEKGLGLSEGQAQRISIARAILYDAPILLLDESTSALDGETEKALLKAIREMTDKTCIIISHKQAAFEMCDHAEYIKKAEA